MIKPIFTITKEDISNELKNKLGFSAQVCDEIVNVLIDELITQTEENGKVTIKNFGKFFINKKNSRPGLNIKTGETVDIPARSVLRFIPSRLLKQKLR